MGFPNQDIENMQASGDIDGLIKALQSEDPDVRKVVHEVLVNIKSRGVIKSLIGLFKGDTFYAIEASHVLRDIGYAAVKPLIFTLENKDTAVVSSAATTLAAIKDTRAIRPLIELLKSKHWENRSAAVMALEKFADKDAIEPLILAVKDEHWMVRSDAITALAELNTEKDNRITNAIRGALNDENEAVRKHAANMLLDKDQRKELIIRIDP